MREDTYSNITQAWAQSGLPADVSGWQDKVDEGQQVPACGGLTWGSIQRHHSHQGSTELVMGRMLLSYKSPQKNPSGGQKTEHHAAGEAQSRAARQGENQRVVCRGEPCVQVLRVQAVRLETSRD